MSSTFSVQRFSILLILLFGSIQIGLCQTPYSEDLMAKAQKGDPKAQYEIGLAIGKGIGINKDTKTGIDWIEKSAKQGYTDAESHMGSICYFDRHDFIEAAKWFDRAAKKGDKYAILAMAELYKYGYGVEKDMKKSAEYLTKAAEMGDAMAMYNLGNYYNRGDGVEQNWDKCLYWYTKAAENGEAGASYNLALLYTGVDTSIKHDKTKAIAYLNQAVDRGYPHAYLALGESLYNGGYWSNGAKDYSKAVDLLSKYIDCLKTTEMENEWLGAAYLLLSKCYRFGRGIKTDVKKADQYYNKAKAYGVTEENIDNLIKELNLL